MKTTVAIDDLTKEDVVTELFERTGRAKKLVDRIVELEAEVKLHREAVVWGFYEDRIPIFTQGSKGEHELAEPLTAEHATNMVALLEAAQSERDRQLKFNAALEVERARLLATNTELLDALTEYLGADGASRRLVFDPNYDSKRAEERYRVARLDALAIIAKAERP